MKSIRSFTLFGIAFLAVMFIIVLGIKANRPVPAELRYRSQTIDSLEVYAPSVLNTNQDASLFLYLQPEDGSPKECQATVELNSNWGIIQLRSGADFLNHLSIPLDQNNAYQADVVIRPASLVQTTPDTVLEISYLLNCPGDGPVLRYGMIDFGVETQPSPTDRFFKSLEEYLSDPGVFTGLASLVISLIALWVTTLLEGDKKRTERQAKLDALEKEFHNDFGHALKQVVELEKESAGWDSDQKEAYARLRTSCESQERLIAYLIQISQMLESDDRRQVDDFFNSAANPYWGKFCNTEGETADSNLTKIFCSGIDALVSSRNGEEITEKRLKSVLAMWDEFDIYSAGVVVYTLSQLKSGLGISLSPDWVRAQLEQSRHRKRLIRYKDLDWMIKAYDLTLPGEYTWDSPIDLHQSPQKIDVLAWLDQPFEHKTVQADPFSLDLLGKTWCEPENWDRVIARNPGRFVVPDRRDLDIVAHQLWDELRKKEGETSHTGNFTVYLNVYSNHLPALGLVGMIARWVAEAWIKFIVRNPDAFLDLTSDERHALTAFLLWQVGSTQALIMRLRHQEEILTPKNDDQQRAEFKLAVELLSADIGAYTKDLTPSEEQLLEWLQIRPPWLDATILIMVDREPPGSEWVQALQRYQDSFHKQAVVIKEFHYEPFDDAEAIRLVWAEHILEEMLGSRISRTTSRETLTGLFPWRTFTNPTEADKKLAKSAQGSLSRMLDLGECILNRHAQNFPTVPELLPEDLSGCLHS